MFRSKSEVDQYVLTSLQKIKTEKERNLRSFHAAQLYYKVQDFDSARKYVSMYLSEKDDSAVAHKLLGDCLEGLGQKTKAIAAYKRSLELQASQPGLLLKICELLCDKDVEFDVGTAKYFLERASSSFPHAPAVFSLKEKLLAGDSSVTQDDFERLIVSELKARPSDVNVRVKLLKLHLETKKVELAYNHVIDVESKQLHYNSLAWYQCSTQIFKAYYDSFPKKCDWEFFVMWITALDRLCFLSLDETGNESSDVVTNTDAIYTLDQTIYLSTQKVVKAPEIYVEFIRHITGQLTFHLAILLMKRAKKESSLWKDTKKTIAPLLLFSTSDPPNTDANWCLSIKEHHRKLLTSWAHQGRCRYAQSGHLLNTLAKECQTVKMFMDKVNHFTANSWRKKVFEKTFLSIDDVSASTSYFVTSAHYAQIPQKVVPELKLEPTAYVQSFEMNYPGCLHHLVWLGLQSLKNSKTILTCKVSPTFHTTFFKNMQFSIGNLHNTGVETLNQLDVDAFLYSTIICTGAVLEDQQLNGYFSPDRPSLLPAEITPTLCTAEQAKWWLSACCISKGGGRSLGNNIKMSDLRQVLQRGIEVVRGDGLPLPLLVCVARTFGLRATEAESIEESEGCENRAVDLWRIAVPILERLASNQSTNKFTSKSTLFNFTVKDLLPNEINALLDEGRYYIANYFMGKEQFEKALELFKLLRSVDANFNLGLIYLKLADEQVSGLRGEEITSEIRCKQVALATKARSALQIARDLIKGDANHPLQHKIKTKFIEVEDLVSRIERESDKGVERDGAVTDDSISLDSGDSPQGVDKLASLLTYSKNQSRNNPQAASTPRRALENKFRPNNSEMNDLASIQQSSNQLKLQQIMEQSKLTLDRLDSIIFEQRSQRSLVEDLKAKFNTMEAEVKTVLADIKKEVKRPDLYNMLDDDDYNPEELLQYPTYPPPTQQRVVVHPNQRTGEPQFANAAGLQQYFSPRVDQMYQNSVNFFNPHATLPFVDGQTVPDYLRNLGHPKFPQIPGMPPQLAAGPIPNSMAQQMPNALGAAMGPVSHLGMTQMPPMMPGAHVGSPMVHGLLPQPKFSTAGVMPHLADPNFLGRGPTNVVITTSDTLPTGTPPAQPTLSVTIPPQHRLGDTSAAHQFQISMPLTQNQNTPPQHKTVTPSAPRPSVTEVVESDDDTGDDSAGSGVPVLPKVDLKTGEENEIVLFEKRAKLFRFAHQSWKEKGTGDIKILKSKTENKYRILMRREKVFDICANHFITGDLKLEPLQEKSWFWVTQDFSEPIPKVEKFSVRFKTPQEAAEFKLVFDRAQASINVVLEKSGYASGTASTPNKSYESANNTTQSGAGSAVSTPKEKRSILAPGRLFTPNTSGMSTQSPGNTFFGTPQATPSIFMGQPSVVSPMFGGFRLGGAFGTEIPKTTSAQGATVTTTATTKTEAPKQTLGGFTFSTPPKITTVQEKKPEPTAVAETKKTDSPFANFSFSKTTENKPTFGFMGGGDQGKTQSGVSLFSGDLTKTSDSQNKPLFGTANQFSDFGALAKAATSQESPLSKLLSDKKPASTPNMFAGAGAPVFGGGSFTSNTQSSPAVNSPQQESVDDFVPTVDFAPVIPLPALVEVKSGEENEEVLFRERSKLFRYDKNTKEWRDRGIGDMKILKNKVTGVVRLLMRREQVHKVCCNHRITKDVELTKSKTNEKAYCWSAKDFSDDTNGTFQQFTIKFKTAEQGLNFEEIFKTAQAKYNSQSPQKPAEKSKTDDKPPLSSLVTKVAGSWECDACCVNNTASATSCIACSTPKPGCEPQKKEVISKSKFSFGIPATTTSTALGTVQTSSAPTVTSGFSFGVAQDPKPPGAAKFSFGIPSGQSQQPPGIPSGQSQQPPGIPSGQSLQPPGIPSGQSQQPPPTTAGLKNTEEASKLPLSAVFSQPEGSWECKECYSRNEGTVPECAACQAVRPGATILSTAGLTNSATAPSFSFGSLLSQTTNITKEVTLTPVSAAAKPETESTGFTFGLAAGVKSFSLGGNAADPSSKGKPVFNFGGAEQTFGKSTFQFSMQTFDPKSPAKQDTTSSDNEGSDHEDHGDNIHFQPVVPLPDIVAVKTGEEEELVLYSHRAKLFRYDKNNKEWRERGVGDVKILQHSSTGKKRLLMRREPIMKLCLNHYLNEEIILKPKDDKSWTWYASDFAMGEKSEENFAIRFKTKEIAEEFYDAVDKAKAKTDIAPAAPKSSSVDSDDDVVYVGTITASDELIKKARSLLLPDNFYLFLNKPPCPGCAGCEPESGDETGGGDLGQPPVKVPEAQRSNTSSSQQEPPKVDVKKQETPSIFGGTPSLVQPGVSLNQPIFGTPSSTFSFSNAATFSFGQNLAPSTEKPSQQSSPQPFFSQESSFSSPDKLTPTASIFGNVSSETPPSSQPVAQPASIFSKDMPTFGSIAASPSFDTTPATPSFLRKDAPTFGALASNPSAVPSFFTPKKDNFSWEGAGSSLFGHLTSSPQAPAKAEHPKGEEGGVGDEDDPEKEAAVHFEPIVPLPDKIELSTGEEDEKVLFDQRAKLFRYSTDTKEWKERGVGNMKVLKHKTNNTFRLLMRREQVHKVVCNLRITPDLVLKPMSNSENSITWASLNLAQEYTEPQLETLALKLKNKDLLEQFKSVVNDAIATVASRGSDS